MPVIIAITDEIQLTGNTTGSQTGSVKKTSKWNDAERWSELNINGSSYSLHSNPNVKQSVTYFRLFFKVLLTFMLINDDKQN